MPDIHLLPTNATDFEIAMSQATDVYKTIEDAGISNMRGFKYGAIPADFQPFVAHEYGLGEISTYFNDYPTMIDAGIDWQRVRGTPAALVLALAWIGYTATVLEHKLPTRFLWNRYQQKMGLVPAAAVEDPLLYDAEYLSEISDPARSVFWRGFEGYDVRILQWGDGSWGDSMWGDDSGVRMPDGTVKWSHGQDYDLSVKMSVLTAADLSLDVENGDVIGWDSIPWNAPGVTWNGVTDAKALKVFLLSKLTVYLGFFDALDNPIGYRRFTGMRDVSGDYPELDTEIRVEISFRTAFGDGDGKTVASVALFSFYNQSDQDTYGKLWVTPEEVSFDPDFIGIDTGLEMTPLALTFRKTVREHITITLEV